MEQENGRDLKSTEKSLPLDRRRFSTCHVIFIIRGFADILGNEGSIPCGVKLFDSLEEWTERMNRRLNAMGNWCIMNVHASVRENSLVIF